MCAILCLGEGIRYHTVHFPSPTMACKVAKAAQPFRGLAFLSFAAEVGVMEKQTSLLSCCGPEAAPLSARGAAARGLPAAAPLPAR